MAAEPERDPARERIRLCSHVGQLRGQLPKELFTLPRWVLWKYEQRGGKLTKVPWTVDGRRRAHADKPETWGGFDAAAAYCESDAAAFSGVAGIGFMLGAGIVGIDLDDCRDPETGEIDAWALLIVTTLDTYGESSPSGTGVHLLCKGAIPGERRRRGNVEMYDGGRFFTMTGYRLEEAGMHVCEERQDALDTLYARTFADEEKRAKPATASPAPPAAPLPDDHQLVMRASGASNGAKFARLWAGDTTGYGASGNDGHSEADMALCMMLAFYTGSDPARMDRLFRQSGLFREKWDEKRGALTYGEMTIFRAISLQTARYDPRRPAAPPDDDGNAPGSGTETPGTARGRKRYHLTEMGNADRLRDAYGDRIRYNDAMGFCTWDGQRWRPNTEAQVYAWAKLTIRAMYAEAAEMLIEAERTDNREVGKAIAQEADRLTSWAIRSEQDKMCRAMLNLIKPDVLIDPGTFDARPYLFNCANGTLDLTTGTLHAHDKGDYLMQASPIAYNPRALAPRFEQFMSEIMLGRGELVEYLRRALGYSMTADVREQVWHLCVGEGANGKSTLMELIEHVLGDYAAMAEPETVTITGLRRDGGAPSPDIARLKGKRFVKITETEEGARLAPAMIKRLSGGDRITARFLRRDIFDFAPTLKVFIYTNHKPQVRETTHAFWRRVRLIPFDLNLRDAPDRVESGLEQRLREESEGVLAWMVRGCLEWQRGGLQPPAIVSEATQEYRNSMDVVGSFLTECCKRMDTSIVTCRALYGAYSTWCEESGERPVSQRRLGMLISERGYVRKHSRTGDFWDGLRLLDEADRMNPGVEEM